MNTCRLSEHRHHGGWPVGSAARLGAEGRDLPELTGTVVYVKTAERPVAGGRRYVPPGDTVVYEGRPGVLELPSLIQGRG
jgi:hypothetical protein